jgi:hypothetical protein
MTPPKPRARLRALLGRLTMAAASVSAAPAAARAAAPVPDLPADDAGDAAAEARGGRAHSLAIALAHSAPLEAVSRACDWALAGDPARRLTVATALGWSFPLVGDDVIIDHLSRDGDTAIRAAAARAAWARRATGGDPGVLERLSADPAPEVREVAWLALRG